MKLLSEVIVCVFLYLIELFNFVFQCFGLKKLN